MRDTSGGLLVCWAGGPVVRPAVVPREPRGAKSQDGFYARLVPELVGALHTFVELLDARLGHARSDQPAFAAINRIIHVVSVLLEVGDIVGRHPAGMLRSVALARLAKPGGVLGRRCDHPVQLTVMQPPFESFGQRSGLGRVFSNRGPGRFISADPNYDPEGEKDFPPARQRACGLRATAFPCGERTSGRVTSCLR